MGNFSRNIVYDKLSSIDDDEEVCEDMYITYFPDIVNDEPILEGEMLRHSYTNETED